MPYRAVIFDLDGTLADTLADLADAMNWTLRQFGLPEHPTDSYRLRVGDGAAVLVGRSLPADRQDLLETALGMMRARYQQHMFDKTRLYDGVPEMLDALADRSLRLAVLSNKPHDATAMMVQRLCAAWRFEAVRGVGPDGVHKPDPRHALAIAEQMGVAPAQCLYLGDTNVDVRTARAAGMFAVGALWGFRDAAELTAAGADVLIAHPSELLGLL